jgi:hypothetical protein
MLLILKLNFISLKILNKMPKKKVSKAHDEETEPKKKTDPDSLDEEPTGEDSAIDPAIIEDTFTEEFSEYNDVDNF